MATWVKTLYNDIVKPPKFCITIVSNFSWVEDNGYAKCWGGGGQGLNNVHYVLCENRELEQFDFK